MTARTKKFQHPLIPAEVTTRKAEAHRAVAAASKRSEAHSGDFLVLRMLAYGVGTGLVSSIVVHAQGWTTPLGVFGAALGTFWAIAHAVIVARRLKHADIELLAAQKDIDRNWNIRAPKSVAPEVGRIIKGINSLPVEARTDFASLLDAVNDACKVLREDPTDEAARHRIAARAVAVNAAVAQVWALEEDLRQQELSVRYRSRDDSDLSAAQAFTEAIQSAREAVAFSSASLSVPA